MAGSNRRQHSPILRSMDTSVALISSPIGVLAVLATVAAFFFLIAELSQAKLFQYIPPLLFIYATPVFLNNLDVIPRCNSLVFL